MHHTNFSHPSAMLQYVAEYTHWDGNHPIPPFWSPTLRASGNSDFVMTIIDVNP
ncbi:MAG TPA: hypothetical protein VFP69_08275 [Streptomyces sp.]|nr:hypothetical protein [Streptomyces sp.]